MSPGNPHGIFPLEVGSRAATSIAESTQDLDRLPPTISSRVPYPTTAGPSSGSNVRTMTRREPPEFSPRRRPEFPAPPDWDAAAESEEMRLWLFARAEFDRRLQAEERTKQEQTILLRRQIEFEMMNRATELQVPAAMIPLLFNCPDLGPAGKDELADRRAEEIGSALNQYAAYYQTTGHIQPVGPPFGTAAAGGPYGYEQQHQHHHHHHLHGPFSAGNQNPGYTAQPHEDQSPADDFRRGRPASIALQGGVVAAPQPVADAPALPGALHPPIHYPRQSYARHQPASPGPEGPSHARGAPPAPPPLRHPTRLSVVENRQEWENPAGYLYQPGVSVAPPGGHDQREKRLDSIHELPRFANSPRQTGHWPSPSTPDRNQERTRVDGLPPLQAPQRIHKEALEEDYPAERHRHRYHHHHHHPLRSLQGPGQMHYNPEVRVQHSAPAAGGPISFQHWHPPASALNPGESSAVTGRKRKNTDGSATGSAGRRRRLSVEAPVQVSNPRYSAELIHGPSHYKPLARVNPSPLETPNSNRNKSVDQVPLAPATMPNDGRLTGLPEKDGGAQAEG